MLGRTDSRRRLLVLLIGLTVVAGSLLVGRLAQWQVLERDSLAAWRASRPPCAPRCAARRGSIYDRSGTIVLATSVDRYRVAAAPDH